MLPRTAFMPLTQRIQDQFQASIHTLAAAAEPLSEPIGVAARMMTDCLLREGKIMACGGGASGLAARHTVGILADRLERDRPGLAAIALHGDGAALVDDADPARGFARQIAALGHPGDVLLAISTYGQARGVVEAAHAAHDRDMRVVALAGGDGGALAEMLGEDDVLICVPAESPLRIHETLLLCLHCICDGIDFHLLGAEP